MRESDIAHENAPFWVGRTRGKTPSWTVYRVNGPASYPDSSYTADSNGLSLAIARCDYLARRVSGLAPDR